MTGKIFNSFHNPKPYIPATLSEIYDFLGAMFLGAPTFVDESFPEQNIESEFSELFEGFGKVRKQLGKERYLQLIDLALQAKAFFADDPEDANGKTDEGRKLLLEIEDVIQATRGHPMAAKQQDDDGEVTGD